MSEIARAYRRTCSVAGCGARVKGIHRMCRVCRAMAAVRKAAQREKATGPAADEDVTNTGK
jgi:hypothetical protein